MERLYFYKLVSPYKEDVTKDCKLTINEIDSNMLTLKDADIKDARFDRTSKALVLTTNENETYIADLSSAVYDLNVDYDKGVNNPDGASITISYDGEHGPETVVFNNIVTTDNLKAVVGSDILTKVITDGTLSGNGVVRLPLRLKSTEKTGFFRAAEGVIDTTKGEKLPEVARLNTRLITKEYVSDWGRLYNFEGVKAIQALLDEQKTGWRVPTKNDWDKMLNSIEEEKSQDHDSSQCHVELGKYAGKFLKTECGWNGQPDCECLNTTPRYEGSTSCCKDNEDNTYVDFDDANPLEPSQKPVSPNGVDKYGFGIYPTGKGVHNSRGTVSSQEFKNCAYFWSTSHVCDDERQDIYVKQFIFDKGGVEQFTNCPHDYFSVRLVKDFDGGNNFENEYLCRENYDTLLFAGSKQVWTARNVSIPLDNKEFYSEVNDGINVNHRRVVFYINDWNGKYWDRKPLIPGDAIVLTEMAENGQFNIEYRVYTEDGCNQVLIDTDDVTTERVLDIVIPKLDQEIADREEQGNILSGAITTEREEREEADKILDEKITAEQIAREEADKILQENIDKAIEESLLRDEALSGAIETEREERISGDTKLHEEIEFLRWQCENADRTLGELIGMERDERMDADRFLSGAIDTEREERISGDTMLNERLDQEIADRESQDEDIRAALEAERQERMAVDHQLEQWIDEERERAINRENEIDDQLIDNSDVYTIKTNPGLNPETGKGEPNLVLVSKKPGANDVTILLDSNFGEF